MISCVLFTISVIIFYFNLRGKIEIERFESGKWIPSDRKYHKMVSKRRARELKLARS